METKFGGETILVQVKFFGTFWYFSTMMHSMDNCLSVRVTVCFRLLFLLLWKQRL